MKKISFLVFLILGAGSAQAQTKLFGNWDSDPKLGENQISLFSESDKVLMPSKTPDPKILFATKDLGLIIGSIEQPDPSVFRMPIIKLEPSPGMPNYPPNPGVNYTILNKNLEGLILSPRN